MLQPRIVYRAEGAKYAKDEAKTCTAGTRANVIVSAQAASPAESPAGQYRCKSHCNSPLQEASAEGSTELLGFMPYLTLTTADATLWL